LLLAEFFPNSLYNNGNLREAPNGLRYPRWGGRRDAVRLGKCSGVEKGLKSRQNPQRRVHALLGGFWM
jgi:hypothetical protein